MALAIRISTAVLIGLAAAAWPAAVSAQTADEDVQAWVFTTIGMPVSSKVEARLDLHAGLTDDAERASQYLVRPSLAFKVNDRLSLGGGYAYVRRDPIGAAAINEHRTFQQARFRVTRGFEGPQLSTTTRLEQRFEPRSEGTGWRLRHQTRLDIPVASLSAHKLVLWNETFYNLNETEWTGRTGVGAMFNFVGVSVPLTEKVTFEPGYLNFRVFRPGGDRVNHVAGLFLAVTL